jgi:hypothetical protein
MCNSIHKYRETIYFNGWDNIAQHALLNVMFVCPNGNVFINAIDTTRECKDAHDICNALVRCIENIGVVNIVQICLSTLMF